MLLHVWRGGGVIGSHERNLVAGELGPEAFDVAGGAQRRGTLGDGAHLDGVVLGQQKVMWASLAGDVDIVFARGQDGGRAGAGADVNDVQGAARLGGEGDGALDRFELGDRRARVEKIARAGATFDH